MLSIRPGLVVEDVDGDILVCDPSAALVHHLDGEATRLVRSILTDGDVSAADSPVLDGLLDAGIVVEDPTDPTLLSRRRLMRAGATATAVGLMTVALPKAAAAASDGGGGGGGGGGGLPAQPTSNPFLTVDSGTGSSTTYWAGVPEAFSYTYSITVLYGSGTGSLTGSLSSSTTPVEIFVLDRNSGIRVDYSSQTDPAKTDSLGVSRF